MKSKIKINKRGDVSVTILVIGVVLICLLTILSFYVSLSKANKGFDLSPIQKIKIIKEKITFYENLEFDEMEIDLLLDIKTEGNNKYIQLGNEEILVRYDIQR